MGPLELRLWEPGAWPRGQACVSWQRESRVGRGGHRGPRIEPGCIGGRNNVF